MRELARAVRLWILRKLGGIARSELRRYRVRIREHGAGQRTVFDLDVLSLMIHAQKEHGRSEKRLIRPDATWELRVLYDNGPRERRYGGENGR